MGKTHDQGQDLPIYTKPYTALNPHIDPTYWTQSCYPTLLATAFLNTRKSTDFQSPILLRSTSQFTNGAPNAIRCLTLHPGQKPGRVRGCPHAMGILSLQANAQSIMPVSGLRQGAIS